MTWEGTWPRKSSKSKIGHTQNSSTERSSPASKESERQSLTASISSKPQPWRTSPSSKSTDKKKLRTNSSKDCSSSRLTSTTSSTNTTSRRRSQGKLRWEKRIRRTPKALWSGRTCSPRSRALSPGKDLERRTSPRTTCKSNYWKLKEWIKNQRKWTNNISNR